MTYTPVRVEDVRRAMMLQRHAEERLALDADYRWELACAILEAGGVWPPRD